MGRGEIAKGQPLLPSRDSPGAALSSPAVSKAGRKRGTRRIEKQQANVHKAKSLHYLAPFSALQLHMKCLSASHQTLQCKNLLQQTMWYSTTSGKGKLLLSTNG